MKTTVIRDGQTSEIRARELVSSDIIIIIEEGHVVPADGRLHYLAWGPEIASGDQTSRIRNEESEGAMELPVMKY